MTNRIVSLHGRDVSVVLELQDEGAPLWRWWGPRVDPDGLPGLRDGRAFASFAPDRDQPQPLVPGHGLGWFGPVGLLAHRDRRDVAHAFVLDRLGEGADAVVFHLADAVAGLRIEQRIALDRASDVLTLSATLVNVGTQPLDVRWLAAATLPLPADCAALRSFTGRHGHEFVAVHEPMPAHAWVRERRRGLTGHGGPPAVLVAAADAGWHAGRVHAVQLAWSGDHRLEVAALEDGGWALQAGAWLAPGEVRLAPGERLASPELLAACARTGINGVLQGMHAAIRTRGPTRVLERPRPVHVNSWEGFYFDHDEARIRDLATRSAALGVERFVLDDGWFKGRDGEEAGLGDWTPDPRKYPAGLGPLAAHVTGLGMEFGLWVEPEMVSPDSDLYRAHPDWALAVPGHAPVTARRQLVLDLSRDDVRAHLFAELDRLLTTLPIGYLKWDHNRDLAPAVGAAGIACGAAQVAGTYALIDRLRAAHPGVEIEAVAGGGGRIDAGMALRSERFWTSDTIDAVARVGMQRGFLHFMPPERMGAHIGASPAHSTGRSQAMAFRAAVALPGHFGLELDPAALDAQETQVLRAWIERYKTLRARLHRGRTWLGEGADGLVWQAQGEADDLLLMVYRTTPPGFARPAPLPLPPVAAAGRVRVRLLATASDRPEREPPLFARLRGEGAVFAGSWLAEVGLPQPPLAAEDCALFALEAA